MSSESYGLLTKEGVKIPLTAVEVKGDITGRSARVKINQYFRNVEPQAIEAVYKFPLPEGSSICGFRAIIGEKIIQGEIEEREKAFELYDKALSEGHGAYLLDEERPNLFTLSLGNLNPGASATIELEYVILLDTSGSEVRFFLPTTISPRYLPPDTKDVKGIPARELVNPPVALDVSYGLKIFLNIQGKENIQSLESPSHNISTTFADNSIKVELTAESAAMDRDFILNIKYQKDFETRGYWYKDDKASFLQLDFAPQLHEKTAKGGKSEQEIIFVLDCSGSMGGSSITEAKRALEILLKALEAGTRFNIYRFGSTFSSLFESCMPYNSQQLDIALKYLAGIDADLGGTEILAPLQAIQRKITEQKTTSIILLTDGQVGNEEQIIDLVRDRKSRMRMFTVGIGTGPNEYFIKQLARTTGGAAELISPNERIEPKVLRLFTKAASDSSVQDITVDWGSEVTATVMPSTVFSGETISIFAKLDDAKRTAEKITISGIVNKRKQSWTADIITIDAGISPIPLLWARTKIREYEETGTPQIGSQQFARKEEKAKQAIIGISRKYGIISRETSLVAVEKRLDKEKTTGEVVLRKVPVMLTDGWGGLRDKMLGPVRERKNFMVGNLMYDEDSSTPSFMRMRGPYSRNRPIHESSVYNLPVTFPEPAQGSEADKGLLNILVLQKAEGGFEIDSALAQTLKVTLAELQKTAAKIQVKGKAEKFLLLSTAIVLKLLESAYADKKATWEGVVQKSRKWLEKQLLQLEPSIDGIKLLEWVDQFLKRQRN